MLPPGELPLLIRKVLLRTTPQPLWAKDQAGWLSQVWVLAGVNQFLGSPPMRGARLNIVVCRYPNNGGT
jgi:hypothetical protein